MKQLKILDITAEIEKKKIKNMYLRLLPPDGRVHISVPIRMKEDQIEKFVKSKYDWILKHQEKMRHQPGNEDFSYITGETHDYMGKKYLLEVVSGSPEGIELRDDRLILTVKSGSTREQRKKLMDRFYRNYLQQAVPAYMNQWENVIGVKSERLVIRDMKTRWGTCNIREKKITMNLWLAKKPAECLEYVIVHELVHLLEGSHNHIFKGYMNEFMPDWKIRRARLNERS